MNEVDEASYSQQSVRTERAPVMIFDGWGYVPLIVRKSQPLPLEHEPSKLSDPTVR